MGIPLRGISFPSFIILIIVKVLIHLTVSKRGIGGEINTCIHLEIKLHAIHFGLFTLHLVSLTLPCALCSLSPWFVVLDMSFFMFHLFKDSCI